MKKIGIYKIISPSNKIYIGQSIDIEKRKGVYKRNQSPSQPKLYNSINKHGWENHIHEIIEECSLDLLNERETYWKQYYLDKVKGEWKLVLFCNLYDTGGGPLREETKQKISSSRKGKGLGPNPKISQAKKGFKYSEESKQLKSKIAKGKLKSEETKQKMSIAHKGKIRSNESIHNAKQAYQNMSLENKLKIINSVKNIPRDKRIEMSKNRWKSVSQFLLNGEWVGDFISIKEASRKTNIRHDSISQCCNQKNKTAGGYIWRFKK